MLRIAKVDTWVASIEDRPGGLLEKLEGLAKAGADLDFILSRRTHEKPGQGVVYVTPLDDRQAAAAADLGFHRSQSLHTLRIDGPDEPGIGYLITRALAEAAINLRGMSATNMNDQFVMFLAFDSDADATRAAERIQAGL